LATTSLWLTVLQSHMLSSTSNIMHCLFTTLGKPLLLPSLGFYHIEDNETPADILSKHWGYMQICKLLQPLLFWGTPRTLMCSTFTSHLLVLAWISNKRGEIRITQEGLPLCVHSWFCFHSSETMIQNKGIISSVTALCGIKDPRPTLTMTDQRFTT